MALGILAAAVCVALTANITAAVESVTVPMLDVGGRPVIEVKINGGAPERLIFDTGASNTVLDPSMTGGANGPVTLKSLEIGSLRFENIGVRSASLFGGALPPDFPKGVLSAAQFPGYLVTFDFPAKTITIAQGALPAADGKRTFEYGPEHVLPVAPIRVGGKEYWIHVDTGSPGGVMLPVRYAKELPLTTELQLAGRARTSTGEFDVFTASVNGVVQLGDFPIADPRLRFSDLRPGPEPGIGNMGAALLKAFKLTFDAKNRRLRFEQPTLL